jgi:hypothetical protein
MKPRHFIPTLFLFLLVAYPLSIGPVSWAWFRLLTAVCFSGVRLLLMAFCS